MERRTSATDFEEQVLYLKKNFNLMAASELADMARRKKLPDMAAAITVDDCYADFYWIAWPILKRYQVPATVYAVTGFISNDLWLWPDEIRFIVNSSQRRSAVVELRGACVTLSLLDAAAKSASWEILADHCLRLGNADRINFIEGLAGAMDVRVPKSPTAEYSGMTWDQLREVSRSGIEVGSHTITHARLTSLSQAEANREICESKDILEQRLGMRVRSFCYPNGTRNDYSDQTVEAVRRAGYTNAVVATRSRYGVPDLYEMGRIGVEADMGRFRRTLSGLQHVTNLVTAKSRCKLNM